MTIPPEIRARLPAPGAKPRREVLRQLILDLCALQPLSGRALAATPALLAQAFRGELVPQDPHDEPATELLRRLAEARSAPQKKTRTQKTA